MATEKADAAVAQADTKESQEAARPPAKASAATTATKKKKKKKPLPSFLSDDNPSPELPAEAGAVGDAAPAAEASEATLGTCATWNAAALSGKATAVEATESEVEAAGAAVAAGEVEALPLSIQSTLRETMEVKLIVEPGAAGPAAPAEAGCEVEREEAEEDAAAEKALASKKQKKKQREVEAAAAAAAAAAADTVPAVDAGAAGGGGTQLSAAVKSCLVTQGVVPTPVWEAELAFTEGWLDKESRNLKQWRKRWVVVLGARRSGDAELPALLCTFKTPRSAWLAGAPPQPTEVVRLSGATVGPVPSQGAAAASQPHVLRLCVLAEVEEMLFAAGGTY